MTPARHAWLWLGAILLGSALVFGAFTLDPAVRQWVVEHQTPGMLHFMQAVSWFGDWPSHVIAGVAGLGIAFWRRNEKWRQIFLAMLIACAIGGATTRAIKMTAGRARPSVEAQKLWNGPTLDPKHYSFPSGHTTASVAFFGTLAFASWRIGAAFVVIPALIAFSRMYVAAHYLSDVIAGALVGLAAAKISLVLVQRRFPIRGHPAVVGLVVFFVAHSINGSPAGYLVYVSNERSGDLSVIDGATDAVVATIPVGKRPRGIHVAPDAKVYVALSGSPRAGPGIDRDRAPADKTADGIGVIDTATQKVVGKLAVGSDPEQFAFTKSGKEMVVANEDISTASVVDLSTSKVMREIKVSEEPEGVGTNPVTGDVYVTCEEEGQVFVFQPGGNDEPAKIVVGARPRSVGFLPDGSRAYVPSEGEASVAVIDAAKKTVLKTIKLEGAVMPMACVLSRDGKEIYVSTGRGNCIVVIDATTDRPVATIPVGERVWGIALSPTGDKLYCANGASNDVSVVDVKARKELSRIKVGDGPWGIAVLEK